MVEQQVPPKVIFFFFFFFFDFSRLQYIFTLQIRIRNPFYQQNRFPLTFSPAGSPLGGSMGISASSLFSAPATDSSPEMVLSPSASLAESLSDFAFVFLGLLCFLPEIKLILLSWTSHYFPYSPPPPLPSSYPPYSSPLPTYSFPSLPCCGRCPQVLPWSMFLPVYRLPIPIAISLLFTLGSLV